jgi:hypothetical protein
MIAAVLPGSITEETRRVFLEIKSPNAVESVSQPSGSASKWLGAETAA